MELDKSTKDLAFLEVDKISLSFIDFEHEIDCSFIELVHFRLMRISP